MVRIIADNIVSPLGFSTEENYRAIKSGQSVLRRYEHFWQLPEPFAASLFTDEQWQQIALGKGYTRFESLLICCIKGALRYAKMDLSSRRVLMIISTTKGNVELLEGGNPNDEALAERQLLGTAAQTVARYFGNSNLPIVVSNACVSGLCAQIVAQRSLESGHYDVAIVAGAEVQSKFIVSGFQCLKALSAEPCKPFDSDRNGLNVGEAAACMIMERCNCAQKERKALSMADACQAQSSLQWYALNGTIRNDAHHISGPSQRGEGCYRALYDLNAAPQALAFVNVHGTSTLFNDEMEAVALRRAGLQDTPINSLKGYYGHTMGAAGVLETVLSMHAVDDNTVLASRGYKSNGVSCRMNISSESRSTDKRSFVKMMSGFGGSNAAMLYRKMNATEAAMICPSDVSENLPVKNNDLDSNEITCLGNHKGFRVVASVEITPEKVVCNGKSLAVEGEGHTMLKGIYKQYIGNYPKFHKMDLLSQLGFVASELLLQAENPNRRFDEQQRIPQQQSRGDRAVILFNSSSSLVADRRYLATISNPREFFPGPSLFVYTLPNIVTGEIAIRNRYYGETSFYVLAYKDEAVMRQIVSDAFLDTHTQSALFGWLDCMDDNHFEAKLQIIDCVE